MMGNRARQFRENVNPTTPSLVRQPTLTATPSKHHSPMLGGTSTTNLLLLSLLRFGEGSLDNVSRKRSGQKRELTGGWLGLLRLPGAVAAAFGEFHGLAAAKSNELLVPGMLDSNPFRGAARVVLDQDLVLSRPPTTRGSHKHQY